MIVGWLDEHPNLYYFLRSRTDASSLDSVEKTLADTIASLLKLLMMFFGMQGDVAEPGAYGIVGFVEASGGWWLQHRTMSREKFTDAVAGGVWHLLSGVAADAGIRIGYDEPLPIGVLTADAGVAASTACTSRPPRRPRPPRDRPVRSHADATVVPFPGAGGAVQDHDDDGYEGPAELLAGDRTVAVTVTLAGHVDPISGHYSWYGRVAASPEVTELVADGARAVVLRTPHAEVDTKLTDVDPWGRPRVEGFGAAPFPVLDVVSDEV